MTDKLVIKWFNHYYRTIFETIKIGVFFQKTCYIGICYAVGYPEIFKRGYFKQTALVLGHYFTNKYDKSNSIVFLSKNILAATCVT